jgi:hypothetical protein
MRLKTEGKRSTMTQERQEILEKLDFVWNTHEATWEDSFAELEAFKQIYGHCNVPSSYMENKLSHWVKRYACVVSTGYNTSRNAQEGHARGMCAPHAFVTNVHSLTCSTVICLQPTQKLQTAV